MLLIERGLRIELKGKATIDFAPSGLHCDIKVPLGDACWAGRARASGLRIFV